jgi:predicted dehydrogenase
MLRFGILSTAKIGYEHLVPAMLEADNCVVTAVASRSLKNARKMAKQFGVSHAFGSYEEMLESNEIDAVYIPLPTSQHVEWSIKAATAGKHVLCEKPISLKATEIKKIIAARDKNGVFVSEAFMVTYHPQWLKVRDLLDKGAIGTLKHIAGSFTYFNKDPKNMRNRPELGGGCIPDIGVYPTVAARFATRQEPKKVRAVVEYDPQFGTDSFANVSIDFDAFTMDFYLSTQLANRQSIVFHGDKGFIELTAPFNSNLYEGDEVSLHNTAHAETRIFRYTGINQYKLEVEAFSRAVAGKKQAIFSLEDSLLNQRVIDGIYKAGKASSWVKV